MSHVARTSDFAVQLRLDGTDAMSTLSGSDGNNPGRQHCDREVYEGFVNVLGLDGITMMLQDWGGPIGLSVAVRHPDRFQALVIGNTFG